jgi:ADP-heptose:LPS heptosyltransferase
VKTSYPSFNRILITRIDRMGDVLLTTPVFESLRRRFPHAHICVMVVPENQSIVDGNPHINEVLIYDKKKAHRSALRTIQYALKLT